MYPRLMGLPHFPSLQQRLVPASLWFNHGLLGFLFASYLNREVDVTEMLL